MQIKHSPWYPSLAYVASGLFQSRALKQAPLVIGVVLLASLLLGFGSILPLAPVYAGEQGAVERLPTYQSDDEPTDDGPTDESEDAEDAEDAVDQANEDTEDSAESEESAPAVEGSATLEESQEITETSIISETLSETIEALDAPEDNQEDDQEETVSSEDSPEGDDSQSDDSQSGDNVEVESQPETPKQQALEGTIIANRSDWPATFFVEGELRRIEPQFSTGVNLPRAEGGLNLFNCSADEDKNDDSCFWDPYLVEENGFYEILRTTGEDGAQKLILERARAPGSGQIWVQNRSGLGELIFWDDQLITLAPTALHEFDLGGAAIATFYMRSCVVIGEDFACEWLPQVVESGVYYSMDEVINPATQANSNYSSIRLTPIQNNDGALIEAPPDALCTLLVPSLNIRSGPGLQYLVLSQAFASGTDEVTVRVIGRDEAGLWLATASDIIEGGWMVYNPELLSCTGDLGALPVAEVTDGRLAPVAETAPAADESAAGGEEGSGGESEEGAEEEEDQELEKPPEGQSLLIIENAFEADIRFTFVDEIDLKPGDRVSVVVNAGRIQFSASSAWRGGMAGNAEFTIEPNETRRMYLYFIIDPDDSDRWLMRYE